MSMFSTPLSPVSIILEMMVYHYVIKNRDKVMYMTIRELAEAAGVSTTTVLRFCRKLQCEGYSEFRVRFKLYLEQNEPQQANIGASEIMSFFKSVSIMTSSMNYSSRPSILFSPPNVLFLSAPAPPARWRNMAHASSPTSVNSANHIDDPYFPVTNDMAPQRAGDRAFRLWRDGRDPALCQPVQPASLQGDVDYQP